VKNKIKKEIITFEELAISIDNDISNYSNFDIDYDYQTILNDYLKHYEIRG
tara:strand:- start:3969 stop:4121 length:153 start_codon:yes stop_codon:yes gene_type:complete